MCARKGFTLIELLIVIAILAILATTVVLVLNPAQLLAEARDGQRLNDLGTIRSALTLYLASVTSADLDGGTSSCSTLCYTHASGVAVNCGSRHGTKTTTIDGTREVNGSGWLPVDFTGISGGAPMALLPIDPTNDATYFYSYACDNTAKTFELDANMESSRYSSPSGSGDVESASKDGGNNDNVYETGSEPGLDI